MHITEEVDRFDVDGAPDNEDAPTKDNAKRSGLPDQKGAGLQGEAWFSRQDDVAHAIARDWTRPERWLRRNKNWRPFGWRGPLDQ